MDSTYSLKGFLEGMKERNYTYASIETYKRALGQFFAYMKRTGRERMQDLTEEDIEKYQLSLVERNFKPNSMTAYMKAVRKYFSWLEKKGIIFMNPCENIKYPKKDMRMQPTPTEDEMAKLIDAIDVSRTVGVRDRAMIETMYSCGLRLDELLNLSVHSIDLSENTVRVMGKGRKERILPLTSQAVEWLGKYVREARNGLLKGKDDDSLWISKYQGRLTRIAIQKIVQFYRNEAKIGTVISPHAIRRATATHLLRAGASPLDIQTLLGHSSMAVLGHYLRVTITDLKQMHSKTRVGQ